VKCRIGVDEQDPEEALDTLTRTVVAAGTDALVVHARKAWLAGLSPKENREIPPLDYGRVHRLKRAWPKLDIIINGGIATIEAARTELFHVDGVMMGRAAYHEPWRLMTVDSACFGEASSFKTPKEAAIALLPYIERECAAGTRLHAIIRHTLGLFHAVPGARAFRRFLATEGVKPGANAKTFAAALDLISERQLDPAESAAA
jgi:tRNA-dihydrouridine synthase A